MRQILQKHLPPALEATLDAAIAKMQAGDFESALPDLRTAYTESGRMDYIGLALAQNLIQMNRCDEAETVLKGISAAGKGPDYDNVEALLFDGNSHLTKFRTDPRGRIIERIDAIGRITRTERDKDSNPLRITRPDGSVVVSAEVEDATMADWRQVMDGGTNLFTRGFGSNQW